MYDWDSELDAFVFPCVLIVDWISCEVRQSVLEPLASLSCRCYIVTSDTRRDLRLAVCLSG
jgi:hypothetical protein